MDPFLEMEQLLSEEVKLPDLTPSEVAAPQVVDEPPVIEIVDVEEITQDQDVEYLYSQKVDRPVKKRVRKFVEKS